MESYPNRDAVPKRLGRYELIGQLATGGMAEIHLARLAGEGGFEKIVVVKRLLPELVASPAYVSMFLDEGKLVARLDHPNICEVHELGRDGAEYYLAMPYLDGIAVHELIARPRDPDRLAQLRVAAGVIVQACAGLHHAHELRDADGAPAGLVHRDVSPSNLFVTSAGVVKVLDFGVAKVRGATETEVGTIKGKQQYMAPEQLLGEPLDRRCDVFALGIVLFELATHQRLFKRASDYLTAKAVLEEPIPRADAIDPAVPAGLADVIARALARDPAQRYATAAELGAALEAVMAAHGGVAGAAAIAAAVTATDELSAMRTRQARVLGAARSRLVDGGEPARPHVTADDTQLDAAPTRPHRTAEPTIVDRRRRRRAPVIAGVLALAVVGAAIAVVMAMRDDDAAHPIAADGAWDGTNDGAGDMRARAGGDTRTERGGDKPVDFADDKPADIARDTPTDVAGGSADFARGKPTDVSRDQPTDVAGGGSTDIARNKPTDIAGAGSTDIARDKPTEVAGGGSTDIARDKPTDVSRDKPTDIARDGSPDRARPPKPGRLSIDSTPWATVYLDGARLGVTPIVKRSVPAGRHKLRVVLEDGRVKELTIDVPAGKLAKPIQVTW